nr:MAG TPA: hypothetical protein [Caudoviricetes sp.]
MYKKSLASPHSKWIRKSESWWRLAVNLLWSRCRVS